MSVGALTHPLNRRPAAVISCARHWLLFPTCTSVRVPDEITCESLKPTMDVYACDPVMPVLPVVDMRGFMTQPLLMDAVPVRGPRVPARGLQEQVPLQEVRSRAS
jgi:hypothetical protein